MPVEKAEPLVLEPNHFWIVCEARVPKTDGAWERSALEVALNITKQIQSAW